MPHGTEYEHTFESFKAQAKAQGGISDDLLEQFKAEMSTHLGQETTDQLQMMDQDADYI